mgnify:CR=1 FL=1
MVHRRSDPNGRFGLRGDPTFPIAPGRLFLAKARKILHLALILIPYAPKQILNDLTPAYPDGMFSRGPICSAGIRPDHGGHCG